MKKKGNESELIAVKDLDVREFMSVWVPNFWGGNQRISEILKQLETRMIFTGCFSEVEPVHVP